MEKLILKFELDRKQMISANDRLHFQKKAKITKFLRQLAAYEGNNVLRDYFGLPYSEEKPCKVIFGYSHLLIAYTIHQTGHQRAKRY